MANHGYILVSSIYNFVNIFTIIKNLDTQLIFIVKNLLRWLFECSPLGQIHKRSVMLKAALLLQTIDNRCM